jgi:hypothetical protein
MSKYGDLKNMVKVGKIREVGGVKILQKDNKFHIFVISNDIWQAFPKN